jgi:hypothetical protein
MNGRLLRTLPAAPCAAARNTSNDKVGGFAMFAPPICKRSWRNNAFPFRQLRRRRRQPSEHRSERSEQSNRARCVSSARKGEPALELGEPLIEADPRSPLQELAGLPLVEPVSS